MHVRDVLRRKSGQVITLNQDLTVADAIARLVQHNIGSLPVVDENGRLVGILSERDIMRGWHKGGDTYRARTVAEVMTPDPFICSCDDDVQDVMRKMSEHHIAKLPVTSGDDLIGIVSVGDVVKVLYEQLQAENSHLMSYLYGQG